MDIACTVQSLNFAWLRKCRRIKYSNCPSNWERQNDNELKSAKQLLTWGMSLKSEISYL